MVVTRDLPPFAFCLFIDLPLSEELQLSVGTHFTWPCVPGINECSLAYFVLNLSFSEACFLLIFLFISCTSPESPTFFAHKNPVAALA